MGYYDSYNPDLLRFIPPDAKTVLEIGCGEGALCEAYRRVNPGVKWHAFEINEKALKEAQNPGRCSTVWSDDVSDPDYEAKWVPLECKPVDCLVFGDVLEHMIDPWKVVNKLAVLLDPGAQVLACIPNVQHWTVIRDLLNGKWEYTDSGLMDRTHLRFFTLDSIRKMFDQAGLQVFEIVGRDLFNEGMMEWADDWITAAPQTMLPKECRAYQYVVRAIKPNVSTFHIGGGSPVKLHIHAVTFEDCCARPRILEPMAMLRTIPGVTTSVHKADLTIEPAGLRLFIGQPLDQIPIDRDAIFVIQRTRALSGIDAIAENIMANRPHCAIILEIDDHPGHFSEFVDTDFLPLRAVHAIQCSTEALAEVCRQYNPNVMVFENQIAELPPWDDKSPSDLVGVFCAWQNREPDWAPIIPALARVIEDHPELFFTVIHDKTFHDALPTQNKSFTPFCEYAEYRTILRFCDIALLPLEDTPFNRCKSDIKFLECAAEGVAVLASETVYRLACGMGNPESYVPRGWIYRGPASFEARLRALVEQADIRHAIAQKAYAYVRDNRLLSQHYRKRYEWYQSLITRKIELDASLVERVPELRGVAANA